MCNIYYLCYKYELVFMERKSNGYEFFTGRLPILRRTQWDIEKELIVHKVVNKAVELINSSNITLGMFLWLLVSFSSWSMPKIVMVLTTT